MLLPWKIQYRPLVYHKAVPRLLASSESSRDDVTDEGIGPADSNPNRSSNKAIAIPDGLRTAGSVFVLAGFLKILIVCFPFSTMAVSMYFQGRADLGTLAAAKMIPLAIGILALAKTIVDRKWHERNWAAAGIAAAGLIALFMSRWAFARPRPSPLDPVIARVQSARKAEIEAHEKRKEQLSKPRDLQPVHQRAEILRKSSRFQ
jgi:hypothetical protein